MWSCCHLTKNSETYKEAKKQSPHWGEKSVNGNRSINDMNDTISRQGS